VEEAAGHDERLGWLLDVEDPAPAVIHWVSPFVITPPPPFESLCSNVPSIM
jgi:hypothetical protein